MSMTINPNMNVNTMNGVEGVEPQIIDVKTGEGTNRAGFSVTTSTTGAVDGVNGNLTPSQEADLEALLEILGLDGENAKNATMQTVLQAIQKAIKEQVYATTTCVKAMSDYDVTRLEALKKAMQGSNDPNAQKIIDNVDRMMQLKAEIESLAQQGYTYDGNFDTSSANFELNTRVREMGDRIADIRYYKGGMGNGKMDELLNTLAPAMKTAVKDLLAAYDQTSGWGVQVNISYSQNVMPTFASFANFISSSDLKLPPQISKDALLQILKELAEALGPNATAAQIDEKMEEKMAEIVAQLADIEIPVQA